MVEPLTDVLIEKALPSKGAVLKGIKAKRKAPDSKCKAEALEALLLLVGTGCAELIISRVLHIVKNHKTPKVVVAALESVRLILHEYGPVVVAPRALANEMEFLLDHKDGTVRNEALKLCIELYRWLRQSLMPMLEKHKAAAGEIETVFGTSTAQKATLAVLLQRLEPYLERVDSEPMPEANRTVMDFNGDALDLAGDQAEASDMVVTPIKGGGFDFDLMQDDEEVDVMASLPSDWFETVGAKKWQERKAALDTLVKVVERVRPMHNADYSMLAHKLMSVIQDDININVIASALQAVGLLAKSLSETFREHAKSLFSTVLNRLKDKKDLVIDAANAALLQFVPCIHFIDAWRFLEAGAKNKAPSIRVKSLELTEEYITSAHSKAEKLALNVVAKLSNRIGSTLVHCSGDTQANVRDAAASTFGSLLLCMGEDGREAMSGTLEKLNKQKGAKHFKNNVNKFLVEKGQAPLAATLVGSEKAATDSNNGGNAGKASTLKGASKTRRGSLDRTRSQGNMSQGAPATSTNLNRAKSEGTLKEEGTGHNAAATATGGIIKKKAGHVAINCDKLDALAKGVVRREQGLGDTQELYNQLKKAKYNSLEEQEAREKHAEGQAWANEEQAVMLAELARLRDTVRSSEQKLRQRDNQIDTLCAQVALVKSNTDSGLVLDAQQAKKVSQPAPQPIEATKPTPVVTVGEATAAPTREPTAKTETAKLEVTPVVNGVEVSKEAQSFLELELLLKLPVRTLPEVKRALQECEQASSFVKELSSIASAYGIPRSVLARAVSPIANGIEVPVGGDGIYGYDGDDVALTEVIPEPVKASLLKGVVQFRALLRLKVADEGDLERAETILSSSMSSLRAKARPVSRLQQPAALSDAQQARLTEKKIEAKRRLEEAQAELRAEEASIQGMEVKEATTVEEQPENNEVKKAEEGVTTTGIGALRMLKNNKKRATSRTGSRDALRAKVVESRCSEHDLLQAQIEKLKKEKAGYVAAEDFDSANRVKHKIQEMEAKIASAMASATVEEAANTSPVLEVSSSVETHDTVIKVEVPTQPVQVKQEVATIEARKAEPKSEPKAEPKAETKTEQVVIAEHEAEAKPEAKTEKDAKANARAKSRGFRDFMAEAKKGSAEFEPAVAAYKIGDRVIHGSSGSEGTVAWTGSSEVLPTGLWFGVVLDAPLGRNDGSIKGVRLFNCEEKHGVISKVNGLMALMREDESGAAGNSEPEPVVLEPVAADALLESGRTTDPELKTILAQATDALQDQDQDHDQVVSGDAGLDESLNEEEESFEVGREPEAPVEATPFHDDDVEGVSSELYATGSSEEGDNGAFVAVLEAELDSQKNEKIREEEGMESGDDVEAQMGSLGAEEEELAAAKEAIFGKIQAFEGGASSTEDQEDALRHESVMGRLSGLEVAMELAMSNKNWKRCQELEEEMEALRGAAAVEAEEEEEGERSMNGLGQPRGVVEVGSTKTKPKWGDWRKGEAPPSEKKKSKGPKVKKTLFPPIDTAAHVDQRALSGVESPIVA